MCDIVIFAKVGSSETKEYDTYKSNLLEVKSEEYAFMIEKQLEEKGYLR